jgi:hypothetical protein
MEAIWMLAGRKDLRFPEYFNSRMRNFSDDGMTLNGAYGWRWRRAFSVDQVTRIIDHLQEAPNSRRAVLTMWGVAHDFRKIDESADVCCNTQAYFDLRHGALNMTVLNRSNDMIWGAYGANVVHFSILQEFVASALGAEVGVYRQFSNNFHAYTGLYNLQKYIEIPPDPSDYDYYAMCGMQPRPLMTKRDQWAAFLVECELFCDDPFNQQVHYEHEFFPEVAIPMARIALARKTKITDGSDWLPRIAAEDWQTAAKEWIMRRNNARKD